jgi:WD40 repeat protein
MIKLHSPFRFGRAGRGALLGFFVAVAAMAACSSSDNRPLLLVDVNALASLPSAQSVVLTVTVENTGTTEAGATSSTTMTEAVDASGKYGVYLADGTSGIATVVAAVYGAGNCLIAQGPGNRSVVVSPGETSGPVIITLVPVSFCGGDGAVPDVATGDGGAEQEAGAIDSAMDGSSDADEENADVPQTLDTQADGPGLDQIAPLDAPSPDLPPALDTGPEVNASSIFKHCTSYTHTKTLSDGTYADFGVRRVVFSPDGQYMVSVGDDNRAKLWDVTATGLAPVAGDIVFPGGTSAAFSSDGKYLAVGDNSNFVRIFDFQGTIAMGASRLAFTLSPAGLANPAPYGVPFIQFTTDKKHVIVIYRHDYYVEPDRLAVWELSTSPSIVRLVSFDSPERPYDVLPGTYDEPMWVASARVESGDASGYVSTVLLTDVSQSNPAKASASFDGSLDDMIFSPDGASLFIGRDTAEVSQWSIKDRTRIERQSPPLIEGSDPDDNISGMAITADGKYLAAGKYVFFYDRSAVMMHVMGENTPITKTIDRMPWCVGFAPSGLALAIGQDGRGAILYCTP